MLISILSINLKIFGLALLKFFLNALIQLSCFGHVQHVGGKSADTSTSTPTAITKSTWSSNTGRLIG